MKSSLLPVANCSATDFADDDYVVFGGTFDPFHKGHLGALQRLDELFSTTILAPTTENPWKDTNPTPLNLRVSMIELVVGNTTFRTSSRIDENGVYVYRDGYEYAEELVHLIREKRRGTMYWAVGEDIADEVKNWRNWTTLGVSSVVLPIEPQIHAADIRSGHAEVLPSIREFVRKHNLYTRAPELTGE